jgi:hypothetical protein
VVVDNSQCVNVVHSGAVLGAMAGAALLGGSMTAVEIIGAEGATGGVGGKEAPRWG